MMVYHPVDFDIDDFLSRIQGNKPPFMCPAETCGKVYKSYAHMQKHMLIHRPPAPIEIPAPHIACSQNLDVFPMSGSLLSQSYLRSETFLKRENLSALKPANSLIPNDSRCSVVFEATSPTAGQKFRCSIFVPLTFRVQSFAQDKSTLMDMFTTYPQVGGENGGEYGRKTQPTKNKSKFRHGFQKINNRDEKLRCIPESSSCTSSITHCEDKKMEIRIPKPVFEIDSDFQFKKPVQLKEGLGYIRFIEKSPDEMDDIVEYDLDEEDLFWLERINKERSLNSLPHVSEVSLEWVMDRFEKEAKFRLVMANGTAAADDACITSVLGHSGIDEDAVCAVCQDGTCENTNVILFCDVCNLAVHQECYGVPYVPEGPWLCRKCLHSPSEPVSCVLCPNRGGAFKKTSDDRWAHVICGLWVPEVMFANLTFLEPLEGIDKIAPARWKLQCFICKQRNAGACIQCHKSSCYRAFHVTCAQHAGLYMKIEHTDDQSDAGIRKSAFCDHHCPPNHFKSANKGMYANSDSESPQSPEQAARIQLRKARKVLAERRNSKPSVCVPIVPRAKIELMASHLESVSGDVMTFLQKAYAFWKLKREFRRGVPLLKRLQACSAHRSAATFAASVDAEAQQMRAQLTFWQQLRQDLEKARLLAELTRKRERVKRDIFRLFISEIELQIQPMNTFLARVLDQLQVLDKQRFFAEPVGPDLAPDYHLIIKHPMDFSTMRTKNQASLYLSLDDLEADFQLMLDNCFQYNHEDSVYCIAAGRLSEQGKCIFREAAAIAEVTGLCLKSGLLLLDQQGIQKPSSICPSTSDDTVQVKENQPSSVSVETARVKLSGPFLDNGVLGLTSHLPLKELANGPVASTTRSQLRISTSIRELSARRRKMYLSNDDVITSENLFRQSRKRRMPSGSPVKKRMCDSVRPAKQERLDETHPSKNLLYWRSHVKPVDLFSPAVPVTTTNNSVINDYTVGTKWAHPCASDSANLLLGHHPEDSQQRSKVQYEAVLSDQQMELTSSFVRKSPAFTHYRLSRPSRVDDEEDEDEDDDDTEESDEPDEGHQDIVSDANAQLIMVSKSTTAELQSSIPRITRKRYRDRVAMSSNGRSSLVVTTFVGNSRMATIAHRRDRAKSHRKTPVLTLQSAHSRRARSDRSLSQHTTGSLSTPKRNKSDNHKPLRRVSSSSSNSLQPSCSLHVDDELRKPLQLRELATSSLTPDLSDVLSHIESPGPLSATTSVEPYEFSNHSVDMVLSAAGSPTNRGRTGDQPYEHHFGPLDVVWAKCRGSPWYPALVVDPDAPEGYCHNGVPVPIPPESVLNWGKRLNSNCQVDQENQDLLVLFFDTKRTWQWLSQHKLQLLGCDSELDRERLKEGKRSKLKHSVIKAYRRAVEHLCKVHGKPYPYVDSRSSHDLTVFTL